MNERGALPVRDRRVKERKMRERVRVKGCIFCFCGEKQKKRVFFSGEMLVMGLC
jgi:hypothetical protein